tara:strand:+ start:322 stop:507 length:186 start_codon:yes stop_codon:yes gene_type:complete
MKKIILTAPLTLILGMFSFTANLEAASCSSHKNKKVKVECSLNNDNCDKTKSEKKINKVEA